MYCLILAKGLIMNTTITQLNGLLKKFKDIEQQLEIGKDTPQVIAKLLPLDIFSKSVINSNKFTEEQISQLKKGISDRNSLITAKTIILKITRDLITKIDYFLINLDKVPQDVINGGVPAILNFIHKVDQSIIQESQTKDKLENEPNEEPFSQEKNRAVNIKDSLSVQEFYTSYFSSSALHQITEFLKTGEMPPAYKKYLTVCFIDMVGFSTMSETLEPEKVFQILNSFFSQINETIENYGGDIDKFMGDALLVTFKSAESALRCGIEIIIKDLNIINLKLDFMDIPEIRVHVGINTGWVIQGNVGSRQRREITVIGDGVNVAARVQSISPPNELWTTSSTIAAVGKIKNIFEQIGRKKLKGRTQEAMIYKHTRKVPASHSVFLIEPNSTTLKSIISEMNTNGIQSITSAASSKELEDQVILNRTKVIVLGPSITIDDLPKVIDEIKKKGRPEIPIIPIIREKIEQKTFAMYEKLGLNIIVPFYKPDGINKLKDVMITEEVKEIPVRQTEPEPEEIKPEPEPEQKPLKPIPKGEHERFSLSVKDNQIALTINDFLHKKEIDNLSSDIAKLWLYSTHKANMFIFNLQSMDPADVNINYLNELMNILIFNPNPKEVDVKIIPPDNFSKEILDEVKNNFVYNFQD